jgi:hypothetical protein
MEIDLTKLCFYDRRNPDFQIKEEYGWDKEEVEATGNHSREYCACDNCFYGRSKLTEQLIQQQETIIEMGQDKLKIHPMTIESARQVLRDAGYFTGNLWHVDDVKGRFECDDDTAQEILQLALTNEYTMECIHHSIKHLAELNDLKSIEQ